jgi:hypothetical protein
MFRIAAAGVMTIGNEQLESGGDGAYSIAISPGGKFAYGRNRRGSVPNIAVCSIEPGPELKRLRTIPCEGVSREVLEFQGYQQGALGFIGSQRIAVTPDGKKRDAANPFGGPKAGLLRLYCAGNVLVFDPAKNTVQKTRGFGVNPAPAALSGAAVQSGDIRFSAMTPCSSALSESNTAARLSRAFSSCITKIRSSMFSAGLTSWVSRA